jgi:hypothetical protein
MTARRVAVLVGSHDAAYVARRIQPDRPSEAAVLTAMRTQRSASVASRAFAAAPRPLHALAAARTRRPVRHTPARKLAHRAVGV